MTTQTPNMKLVLPEVGVTTGDTYATLYNTLVTILDRHDHSSGRGVKITPSGINITAELEYNNNPASELKYAAFQAQSSEPVKIRSVYFVDNDLYVRTGEGTSVKLTSGGGFNSALVGGIGGDYSTSGASLEYNSITEAFSGFRETNFYANLDIGPVRIHNTSEEAPFGVRFTVPTGVPADYDLQLPSALPTNADSVFVVNTSGVMSLSPSTVPVAGTGNRFLKFTEAGGTEVTQLAFSDFPVAAGDAYKIIHYNSEGVLSSATDEPLLIPSGTTADRPGTPSQFMFWGNSSTGEFEAFINGTWKVIPAYDSAGLALDDVIDVNITSPQNNQALVYNSATSTWINAPATLENVIQNDSVFTADLNKRYLFTTSSPQTVYLPEAPSDGGRVAFNDVAYAAGSATKVILCQGDDTFVDGSIDGNISINGEAWVLQYNVSTKKWFLI